MQPALLEARNVSKLFGSVKALSDVSLSIRAGEVHSIIGENGAGKSTLMNIFCGRLQPTSGELLVEGKPVTFRAPSMHSAPQSRSPRKKSTSFPN
jgi:ribose transport system ATP-binding protein